jgi:hypothetical protein
VTAGRMPSKPHAAPHIEATAEVCVAAAARRAPKASHRVAALNPPPAPAHTTTSPGT